MKLFGKRNIALPNEVRMQYSAPSFSFYMGKRFDVDNSDEAEKIIKEEGGNPVLLIHPGINLLENPSSWVKALLGASSVVVMGNGKEPYLASFVDKLEKQIFSPIPKALAGSIVLEDEKEAAELLLSISSREKKKCITFFVR